MTVVSSAPFVQNAYNDQYGLGFPGTIFSAQDAGTNNKVLGYSAEFTVFCGRGVVKRTAQNFTNNDVANLQPFTIMPPTPTSVAGDLVGVVVRPYTVTQNHLDIALAKKIAGFGATDVAPILSFGSGQRIIVRQDALLGNVTHGDPVYIAVDTANSLNLEFGEFANQADVAPANTVLVPNAIWYLTKDTSTAVDDVNIIQLL